MAAGNSSCLNKILRQYFFEFPWRKRLYLTAGAVRATLVLRFGTCMLESQKTRDRLNEEPVSFFLFCFD
jgi:hypothetical protein